ncbi:MAG: methionine--tRNA ligase [Eubacteriales bacterium]
MKETFYITTPIYYPSGNLHIGHSYCTVAADVCGRYHRLLGKDVLFLTGTDEHGQKIEDIAKAEGVTPQEFVDKIVKGKGGILDLWDLMDVKYDRFIRTTDDYHHEAIGKIFKALYEKGDIYKGTYEGKYCKPCESFWTESQLQDGKCPDCGREVAHAQEEAYFFRLSKYADRVMDLLENTDFLEPRSRVNEMVNNFLKPGLEDLCVSRTTFTWGIPVDFDPGHVVYVWLDALFNYTTALGLFNSKYNDYDKYWPADVHFVGKEIVRFHAIIWPAMLMAMDMPLPKKVYGHGWLLFNGEKISKSKELAQGEVATIVDPAILCQRYGVDALRYFLLRDFPFGSDGSFTNKSLISRINTDLANDIGNLLSRSVSMVEKYFDGTLPESQESVEFDADLEVMANALGKKYQEEMEKYAFQNALAHVFALIGRANKYIDETAPWNLAKEESNLPKLANVLYHLIETLRLSAVLLSPVMPSTAEKILNQLAIPENLRTWDSVQSFGNLPKVITLAKKTENLFPRIDMEKELADLLELAKSMEKPSSAPIKTEALSEEAVDFDTFIKIDFRAVKVIACQNVKKSDKLLQFTLDDGTGTERQILSGIAKFYSPEELVGKTLMAIVNLPPRKMMGKDSCGMLISAVHEENGAEKLNLLILDDNIPAGAKMC